MIINLEAFRSVVRPYASRSIGLPDLLEKLWPMLASTEGSKELGELIEDLLALHAAGSIDDIALRQRLVGLAFSPGEISGVAVSDLRPVNQVAVGVGGISQLQPTRSLGQLVELIPA